MLRQVRDRLKELTAPRLAGCGSGSNQYFLNDMNVTRKIPQKSSNSPKNPYDATGSCDNTPTKQNKAVISRIAGDFGLNCQNDANFAARAGLGAAQKSNTHQKTTAIKARRGFTFS